MQTLVGLVAVGGHDGAADAASKCLQLEAARSQRPPAGQSAIFGGGAEYNISWKDYNLVKTQVKSGLAKAILEQNITESTVWVINLHKYIILYGLNFSRADHIYLIKVHFK